MSIVHVKRPDELVTCPYNPAHRVSSLRFPGHLIKCEKDRRNKMAVCPFNASHRIPEMERAAHISTCPDKVYVERTLVAPKKTNINPTLHVPSYENELPPSSENWEDECNPFPVAGYDPTARMNELTFRNAPTLVNLSKSQRRHYYNQLHSSHTQSINNGNAEETLQQITPVLKQLRLPKEEAVTEKAQQPPNRSLGMGRGQGRLAANIFKGDLEAGSSDNDKMPGIMTIARGRGIARPDSSASKLPLVGQKAESISTTASTTDFEDASSDCISTDFTSELSQSVRGLGMYLAN